MNFAQSAIKGKMKKSEAPLTVEVPEWYRTGGMMFRRSALSADHPESEYNYIKKNYPGVDPIWYGATPPSEVCEHCGSLKRNEEW